MTAHEWDETKSLFARVGHFSCIIVHSQVEVVQLFGTASRL